MNMNLRRNHSGVSSDAEIERDVAELRQLLSGIEGPKEPHPAYWQNFVVHVRRRIDEDGGRRKRISFSTAWASVGAAALVVVAMVGSGVFSQKELVTPATPTTPVAPAAPADLAAVYDATGTESLILSGEDMKLIDAIVAENDEDVFEALVEAEEL